MTVENNRRFNGGCDELLDTVNDRLWILQESYQETIETHFQFWHRWNAVNIRDMVKTTNNQHAPISG